MIVVCQQKIVNIIYSPGAGVGALPLSSSLKEKKHCRVTVWLDHRHRGRCSSECSPELAGR